MSSRVGIRSIHNRGGRLVDLFCGGGGFSLGAHQAGFQVAASFDNDAILSSSYKYNFPKTKFVLKDVRSLDGDAICAAAGGPIDGIFGGPPCQGFSSIGRRSPDDPRRQLLHHFFRIVNDVQPAFFVMENVRGLSYDNAVGELEDGLQLVKDQYAIMGPHIWDARNFGAATTRPRLFVIGIHKDPGDALNVADIESFKREYARALRSSDRCFTGQRWTAHSQQVIERFANVPQGGIDPVGRHPRLAWSGQCPTLRAGTGVDRGSYQSVRPIHPEHPRVITVREAARLQGFPDGHRFHPTVWHSFRMIGNSVSPPMARAIFCSIQAKLAGLCPIAMAAE